MHKILALSALACACVLSVNATPILNVDFQQDNDWINLHVEVLDAQGLASALFYFDDALVNSGPSIGEFHMVGLFENFKIGAGAHNISALINYSGGEETLTGSITVAPYAHIPDAGATSAMTLAGLAFIGLARRRMN